MSFAIRKNPTLNGYDTFAINSSDGSVGLVATQVVVPCAGDIVHSFVLITEVWS